MNQEIKETAKNLKNFSNDKKAEKPFTVRFPSGTSRSYKTFEAAKRIAENAQLTIEIPGVVTANTYFWTPGMAASCRRANERRRETEIETFCETLNHIPGIEISGYYTESCNHVRKSMTYMVNDKITNLTGLIGTAKKWGINLEK